MALAAFGSIDGNNGKTKSFDRCAYVERLALDRRVVSSQPLKRGWTCGEETGADTCR